MTNLTNKVAIITGASSGIGFATAKLFSQHGAKLVLVARRQAELNMLIDSLPYGKKNAVALVGDVKDELCAKTAVELAVNRFGKLDIAFNNAGILGELDITQNISSAGWKETLDTNLTSAFFGSKYQIPALLEQGAGSLIFTSTFVGYTTGLPEMAAYAASKAGVLGLMKVLATELGPQGIRVNAILPGGTDTAMFHKNAPTNEAQNFIKSLHALKRIASPDEIAQSVLYLASDISKFTTGTAMLVDIGFSINKI